MAQVYFHCSSTESVLLDRRGSEVENLMEARERAVAVVQRFISSPGPQDWREWILHSAIQKAKRYSWCRSPRCLARRISGDAPCQPLHLY
jgi:hypothetical protein